MTLTIEQAADLVISGPGTVREKIIAGIEAYAKSLPSEQLCEDEGCPHHGTDHICISPPPHAGQGCCAGRLGPGSEVTNAASTG